MDSWLAAVETPDFNTKILILSEQNHVFSLRNLIIIKSKYQSIPAGIEYLYFFPPISNRVTFWCVFTSTENETGYSIDQKE